MYFQNEVWHWMSSVLSIKGSTPDSTFSRYGLWESHADLTVEVLRHQFVLYLFASFQHSDNDSVHVTMSSPGRDQHNIMDELL